MNIYLLFLPKFPKDKKKSNYLKIRYVKQIKIQKKYKVIH